MLRFINVCLLLGLIALAYVIYHVKYQARALDHQIASLNRQINDERDSIAVLRAEWSLLNRPGRIERLAEKFLNLQSPKPDQIITLDSVTQQQFNQKFQAVASADQHKPDAAPAAETPARAPSE